MADLSNQVKLNDSSYSIETEQAILCAVLRNPQLFTDIALQIKSEYFYLTQHREIFDAMVTIDAAGGKQIDPLLLIEMLKTNKIFGSEADAKQYLFNLVECYSSESNIANYCQILKDKYYIRSVISASKEIIDIAENSGGSADDILNQAEQKIYDIRKGRTVNGPEILSATIRKVYKDLIELNSDKAAEHRPISTGFPDLDNMITGLNRSDLVLIGARPAMGKTSFTLNMARNVAVTSNKKVLVFSLEMSKEQLAQRLIATEARVDSKKMRTGMFTPEEWSQIHGASVYLSKFQIYLDDSSMITVPEMKARARRIGADALFIDYLQLMKSAKNIENRTQEVSDITRNLKLMAKDLLVPVVVCAQLSRQTEGRGQQHKPQLADLRESGSIEQDADIVLMLYRPDYYKTENDKEKEPGEIVVNSAELLVQKNRHGPTGSVNMIWDPRYTLYTCAVKNDMPGGNNNAE